MTVLILLAMGKNCITGGSSQLLYLTYNLAHNTLWLPINSTVRTTYWFHTAFFTRVYPFPEETTGKKWMFILKLWINCCSNTFEKRCEHRMTESLCLVRRYRATHIQLRENVCSVKHVLYIYTYTHLHAHLLSYSMEQSPSWGANRFAASQEFPLILWPAEVHYRIHKCPPPVPILNNHDPVLNSQHPNSWKFILILSSLLFLCLHSGLIFPAFQTKKLHTPLHSSYSLHAPPISFSWILSPTKYWVRSTYY